MTRNDDKPEIEELDDEEGKVYLWRIPEEWSGERVDDLAEEISPRFDEAFHLFAEDGMSVEDVSGEVEIVGAADGE